MIPSEVVTYGGFIIALVSFYFVISSRGRDIEKRLTGVETKIEIFWRDVSFDAAKVLHTPHIENSRRDFLIVLWEKKEITKEELYELIGVLALIIPDEHREMAERMAASILQRALQAEYNIPSVPMANITPNKT